MLSGTRTLSASGTNLGWEPKLKFMQRAADFDLKMMLKACPLPTNEKNMDHKTNRSIPTVPRSNRLILTGLQSINQELKLL